MRLRSQYKGINSNSKEEENPRFYERDLAEAFMQGKSEGLSPKHALYICSQNTKAGSLLSHTPCPREVIMGQVLLTKREPSWMPK